MIAPRTLQRYHLACQRFVFFVQSQGWQSALDWEQLDQQLCEYLERLWACGDSKSTAGYVLSGTQFLLEQRRIVPRAWGLLKVWNKLELPNRAPPMPPLVAAALVGRALYIGMPAFACIILVGFAAFLRTGELLNLHSAHVTVAPDLRSAVITLPSSKSAARTGHIECVVIDDPSAVALLARLLQRLPAGRLWTESSFVFRRCFLDACSAVQVGHLNLRPYSLRRGGATHFFQTRGSLDLSMERGRWSCVRTARVYLVEGLQELQKMQIPRATELALQRWAARAL